MRIHLLASFLLLSAACSSTTPTPDASTTGGGDGAVATGDGPGSTAGDGATPKGDGPGSTGGDGGVLPDGAIVGGGDGPLGSPDMTQTSGSDMTQTSGSPDMTQTSGSPDMTQPSGADMTTMGPPPELVFYSAASGIGADIIDSSPDEGGNIWAVSTSNLYILRPKDGFFRKYGNADGLHVYSTITAVAGAGPGEGYVGLEGHFSDYPNDDPSDWKDKGKAEHVHLMSDASIMSVQYANLHNDNSANYWETRSARRLLYGHTGPNAGHLFMGGNHGITHIVNDGWGDHIHVDVKEPNGSQLLGEFYGLALDPATNGLWTCGAYACGLQRYYADPKAWVAGTYKYAFTVYTSDHSLSVPFGYRENHHGATVGADGVLYVVSPTKGVASWDPATGTYTTIQTRTVPGLGKPLDVAADPDGTIWITDGGKLLRWDPKGGSAPAFALPNGAGSLNRLYVDTTVTPRALYISTGNGVAVYRGK